MVFVSMSLRLRVEVEALNMVEAFGAYGRHRTVSVLRPRPDGRGYRVIVAPGVSGQAVAFGYMRTLLMMAEERKLPVCDECKSFEKVGGFVKHGTLTKEVDERTMEEITEFTLIRDCVVEDVTGFLVPRLGIRRTSPVQFSYMVPDVELSDVAIEPQFHVRSPMPGSQPQPFHVEACTAVYVQSVFIDVDRIGRGFASAQGLQTVQNRKERVEAAISAVGAMLEGLTFGAKKSRYYPFVEAVGAVAAVSKPLPFAVPPARMSKSRDYVQSTVARAGSFVKLLEKEREVVKIAWFSREGGVGGEQEGVEVRKVDELADLIRTVRDWALELGGFQ